MASIAECRARLDAAYGHPVSQDFVETFHRISQRVEQFEREEAEKLTALLWCRANGNPHVGETA